MRGAQRARAGSTDGAPWATAAAAARAQHGGHGPGLTTPPLAHPLAAPPSDLKMDNTLLDDNDPPRIKLCDVRPPGGPWRERANLLGCRTEGKARARSVLQPQRAAHLATPLTAPTAPAAAPQFGFARNWMGPAPQMTTITGTPDYMSPQLLGAKIGAPSMQVRRPRPAPRRQHDRARYAPRPLRPAPCALRSALCAQRVDTTPAPQNPPPPPRRCTTAPRSTSGRPA
jgi:hypothetical protein